MAYQGTHDVQKHGSRAWRQRLKVSCFQKVKSGTLLVINAKTLKPGLNTYSAKNNIHASVDGRVNIKNGIISIIPHLASN
ncbi:MAG: hypothetical protein NC900_03630 [Candidatus Omnitrophica bacterium]|nr:hypothetical protein [Candidatus Omnitrophota bacterium]